MSNTVTLALRAPGQTRPLPLPGQSCRPPVALLGFWPHPPDLSSSLPGLSPSVCLRMSSLLLVRSPVIGFRADPTAVWSDLNLANSLCQGPTSKTHMPRLQTDVTSGEGGTIQPPTASFSTIGHPSLKHSPPFAPRTPHSELSPRLCDQSIAVSWAGCSSCPREPPGFGPGVVLFSIHFLP